jgi:UDPglucose 6-dehydrogenase
LRIIETVVDVNARRKKAMADRVIAACGGSVKGKTIGILGLAFKPNTDDMRDSPSLDVVPALLDAGATIKAYDPEAMEEAAKLLDGITYCKDAFGALEGADAMVLLTEWNEFRGLNLKRVKESLKSPVIVDLRNVYEPSEMREKGFEYSCIGRGTIGG